MLTPEDIELLVALQQGLSLTSRPYLELAKRLGVSETEVMERLKVLSERGIIKRLGLIVKHRQLGYVANAMVVWDVPDAIVQTVGQRVSQFAAVNLCYLRQRQLPQWRYNLYCMIHGKTKASVLTSISSLEENCQLNYPREILFSRRCFKQRGAFYCVEKNSGKK